MSKNIFIEKCFKRAESHCTFNITNINWHLCKLLILFQIIHLKFMKNPAPSGKHLEACVKEFRY